MTIADQIRRLQNAKAAIKQALANKGVTVSDDAKIDEYPALIDSIQAGGSDTYYEDLLYTRINRDGSPIEIYSYLFTYCNAKELNLSRFDTSNAYRMSYMFNSCSKLTSLDLSNFNTSNVIEMDSMFGYCQNLTSLDLSNFDTSKVLDMSRMFYECNKLTSLDLSSFDTSKVEAMTYMFSGCKSLTSIDVSNFNTSKVTTMSRMFCDCNNLTSLDLSNFDTSKVTTMSSMFENCKLLTSLNLSSFDVGLITSTSSLKTIINNCIALVDFQAPKNINGNLDVSTCKALSHDSIMSIINNLKTTTSTKTLTLGSTNLAKITDDEKAIATSKGWTVK